MKVKDILKRKGTSVVSVTPGQTVLEALKKMADMNVGGVMVMEGEKMIGIFTERDYARKIVLKGRNSSESRVSEVMVTKLITVNPESNIAECMTLMTDKMIRHLPVVENGKLAGIISISDVVKAVIEEQQNVIQHLEQYIAGA